MSLLDSADLYARTIFYLNLPSTHEAVTAANVYQALTEAQARVVQMLAFAHPEAVYSAPTLLATTDNGLTYKFGTDSGLPTSYQDISAMGYIRLLSSKTGPEIPPGTDTDNTTDVFIFEDGVIRWPGQRARTFADGPYARFVTPSGTLSDLVAPTLKPVHLRSCLPWDACKRIHIRLGNDPTFFEEQFQQEWQEQLLALKSRFWGQGRANLHGHSGPWWRAWRSA